MVDSQSPALGTVVTYDHLPRALTLVRSIRATWQRQPTIYIALLDHAERPRPGFESVTDCHILPIETLGPPNLPWLALKLPAFDFCAMAKPYLLLELLRRGHRQVVYCDADMLFFSDPAALLAFRPEAALLTTPHLLAPLPPEERARAPTMGEIATAGMMNNGLFRVTDGPALRRFLADWGDLITGRGCVLPELGGQTEQQAFNWAACFLDEVVAFRDPRYNLAYWNLHERPLRWAALDGGPADRWLLGGEPIVCFHFSGFDGADGRLSRHDTRHDARLNPNLLGLRDHYAARLAESATAAYGEQAYRYAAVEGEVLVPRVRTELRRLELREPIELDDWADAPRPLRALNLALGPLRAVPAYLDGFLDERHDLAAICAGAELYPHRFLRWLEERLHHESDFAWLYDRHCPFAYERARLASLAAAVAARCPDLDLTAAEALLREDRLGLLRRLADQGDAALAYEIVTSNYRVPAYDPAICLRRIYQLRSDLQRHFPDPLGADREAFACWVRHSPQQEYLLPPTMAAFTASFDAETALASVLGFCQRHDVLRAWLRRDGLDQALLRSQLRYIEAGSGVSAGDLILADWWLTGRDEAERRALGRVVPGDLAAPGSEDYLDWWLRRHAPKGAALPAALRAALAAFDVTEAGGRPRALTESLAEIARQPAIAACPRLAEQFQPAPEAINLFGQFHSPIGLGYASRGVAAALSQAAYRVRRVTLTTMTMERPLRLDDLTPDPNFGARRNLFVSYPHIDFDLFDAFPPQVFAGRESAVYLAWEQRDFHPLWAERLARFDRLFALSSFTAAAVARGTGRACAPVPCVVEVDEAAAAAWTRQDFDLPAEAFVVSLVMDATSALERKNPLGAVEAIARAFGGRRDVVVALKIAGGEERRFAAQVRAALAPLKAAGLACRLITGRLPKAKVEALIKLSDVYLSLHRAEGFGYTIAEAMLLGTPVVATGYSGNMDFMSADNAFAVPWRECLVTRAEGPFQVGTVWADPDLDAAAALLRQVRANPEAARQRAARARREAQALLSTAAVAKRWKGLLG